MSREPDRFRRDGDATDTSRALSQATARIRRAPVLLLPFTVAGLVFVLVDWLRIRDPIPFVRESRLSDDTISLEFAIYPFVPSETTLPFAALVDLRLPYLAWALGLEVVTLLAVGVAGWYTIARAIGTDLTAARRRLPAYLGFVVAVGAGLRLLGGVGDPGILLGLVAFVVVVVVFVRLFAVPALLVAGDDVSTAIRRSAKLTAGEGWTVLRYVFAFGLSTWFLASVPHVGVIVAAAVVAPAHAVCAVTFVELASDRNW